jgi:hypothetical protein
MSVLDDIRRAAFELRQTDPQEAVRVLRQAAAQGGEAEVLARGALGEIYLEEFGDLDGAESEFRKVLQAAPRRRSGSRARAARRATFPRRTQGSCARFQAFRKMLPGSARSRRPARKRWC